MKRLKLLGVSAAAVLASLALSPAALASSPAAMPAAADAGFQVAPVYYKLPNGLKVILLKDARVPTVTVAVHYGIGFRIEPQNRTGFAHLFEHLLFQGSQNAPKGAFINLVTNSGGAMNGSTRFDYTNYYQVVPSGALEAMIWGEADRMARPVINEEVLKNQQEVVSNEVRVNVLNQPYGGYPWLWMPMAANTNWYNAHNFYGELAEIQAASVEDAKTFHDRFYGPNNSVLFVGGDFDEAQTRRWIEQYFGAIPATAPVVMPDISEPRQTEPRRVVHKDALAPRPAWAAGWHVPARNTPEWYAMGLINQIMAQGTDSRLYNKLVREKSLTSGVSGSINMLGNQFTYNGPMQFIVNLTHDPSKIEAEITAAVDEVVADLQNNPVTAEELQRAKTKIRSSLYSNIDSATRFGIAEILSSYALFDDNPAKFNEVEAGFAAVTPELIQQVAREYLRDGNRTLLILEPGAAQQGGAEQ
ncbi:MULTISPECIES: M16 family metallopeptidase [unclassified Brevundimonas]|uniref:M16 family metallopeptidase n=1 Tax=unclassified Brevundimonas TaxID=2622653 RepID=UPI0025C60A8B|nr:MULTISPECIES: pitrilysin family protein [unclassified Brevundimonas]